MSELRASHQWSGRRHGAITDSSLLINNRPDCIQTHHREVDSVIFMKINTQHIFPPIPDRSFDWLATVDDMNEDSPKGWGKTEAEAIADLKSNLPEDRPDPRERYGYRICRAVSCPVKVTHYMGEAHNCKPSIL